MPAESSGIDYRVLVNKLSVQHRPERRPFGDRYDDERLHAPWLEGVHDGKVYGAEKRIARGKMILEEIAEDMELPLEKVQELARKTTIA